MSLNHPQWSHALGTITKEMEVLNYCLVSWSQVFFSLRVISLDLPTLIETRELGYSTLNLRSPQDLGHS